MHETIGSATRPRPHRVAAVFLIALLSPPPAGAGDTRLAGVIRVVEGRRFLVDSSWVETDASTRWRGKIRSPARVVPGQFAVCTGAWTAAGRFRPDIVQVHSAVPGARFQSTLRAAGSDEAARLEASADLVSDDPRLTAFVRRVGRRVTPERPASLDFDIRFHLIDNRHRNAFALPSGDIFVHTGLLAKMDSEDQLGAVLGHEVAHITGRHTQRLVRSQLIRGSIFQTGLLGFGLAFEDGGETDRLLVTMAGLGLQYGYLAATNGFGRDLEDQADRVGLRFAWEAGYNPKEAPAVWEIFAAHYGDTPAAVNFFYSDHSTNRIRHRNQELEIGRHYQAVHAWSDAERAGRQAEYLARVAGLVRRVAVADWQVGQKDSARTGFEKLLRLDPNDPEARDYLARPE